MSYKVTCENDNFDKVFDDCVEALIVYNSHNKKGHKVSLVPVGDSTYESFKECLNKKSVFNSVFRISQNPLGLSYSVPNGGSFSAHKSILADNTNHPEEPPKNSQYNFYFERLVKLIPSEIVGLYLALYAIGLENNGIPDAYGKWIAIICFILVFVSRVFGTKVTGYNTFKYFKTVQWGSIIISAISFVIWVYAMGHTFPVIGDIKQIYVKAAIVIWTFVVPLLYQGEK